MQTSHVVSRIRGYLKSALRRGLPQRHISRQRRSVRCSDACAALTRINTLEDRILLATLYDFGDAPFPYPVTLAENGPRHLGDPNFGAILGTKKDGEADGTHSVAADADGADEDGVTFGTIRVGQLGATILVNMQNYLNTPGQTPRLDAWIDFNQDGTWGGPFEQIATAVRVYRGNTTISFDVPSWASSGTTYARFRVSELGNLSVTGLAPVGDNPGEVEDYAITILPPLTTNGDFGSQQIISSTNSGPESSVAADFNGDGDMDIVTGFFGSNTVTWFENDGQENFSAHVISASAHGVRNLVASDLDRDGDMDIVAALADTEAPHHRFEWYRNDGSGNFTILSISVPTAPGTDPSDPGPRSVFVADVDGDGDMDVIGGMDSFVKVALYENDGHQSFTKHPILEGGEGEGSSVVAADVDRDGDMDIVAAIRRSGELSWFENVGSLNFTRREIAAPPATSADLVDLHSVFAADLDGDLDMDVVVAGEDASPGDDGQVLWYENNGSEVFTPHVLSANALGAYSVFAADMNGDGRMDVLSASKTDSKVRWFQNEGSRVFTELTIYSKGTNEPDGPSSVFATDIDSDRDLDVLASINYENRVAWFSNRNGLDFGDAPAGYPVTLAEDGARHTGGWLFMGAEHDEEPDGTHSSLADADDITGVIDDEDGVKFSFLIAGSTGSSLTVTSSGTGKIDAWLDVNQDGDWLDAGENIIESLSVVEGENLLEFDTPPLLDSGIMFARVRLSTAGGLGMTGAAEDGEVEDHRLVVQLQSPTITGPATPVTDLRPTLTWTAVAAATSYKVSVKNLSTNTTNYHVATVSGTSYTPPVDFGIGQYSYTVQAFGTPESNSSFPSPAYTFQIQVAVQGLRVTTVSTAVVQELLWDKLPGARSYDVWVDNLTRNETQFVRRSTAAYWLSMNLPYGSYRAWVRGLDASGKYPGSWSASLDFSTLPPAPVITHGANPTYNYTPTFAWNAVPLVTGYDLVIRNMANGSTVIAERNIPGTSWTPPVPLADGIYRWWLIAISADGIRGVWTDPHDFTLRTGVTGLRVTSASTTLRPVLLWNAFPGAAKYDVWIDNLTTGQSQFVRDENVLTNSFSPASDLPYGHYRAWVRGLNAAGEPSNWSKSADFRVILPAPVITQGLNPTFDRTPTFGWNPVEGAVVYDVYLINLPDYVTSIVERNIPGTSWTPTTPIADGPWRWWVCAISANNIRGEWTFGGDLTLGTDIYIGGQTNVLTPKGTTSDTTPTFSWRPVDGAVRYDLWVDQLGEASQVIREQSLTTTSFVAAALPVGNYRTWVRAISATNEHSPWSLFVDFTIFFVDTGASQDPASANSSAIRKLRPVLISPLRVNNSSGIVRSDVSDNRETPVSVQPDWTETEQADARTEMTSSDVSSIACDARLFDVADELRDAFIQRWLMYPVSEC